MSYHIIRLLGLLIFRIIRPPTSRKRRYGTDSTQNEGMDEKRMKRMRRGLFYTWRSVEDFGDCVARSFSRRSAREMPPRLVAGNFERVLLLGHA